MSLATGRLLRRDPRQLFAQLDHLVLFGRVGG